MISDENVEEYKTTPILTLEERVKMISTCRYVDEVIVDSPLRLLKQWLADHQIDYVVHRYDFNPELLKDFYGSSLDLGIFRSVSYTPAISTSQIIQRIVAQYKQGKFRKNEYLKIRV